MATAVLGIAQLGAGLIGGLLNIGHADDAVDNEEQSWGYQFFGQCVSEALGRTVSTVGWYNGADDLAVAAIAQINPATTPMTSDRATQWINAGDQQIAQLCAAFAQAGYPCWPPLGPGKPGYGGGAGRDLPRIWPPLRAKLVQIAQGGGASCNVSSAIQAANNPNAYPYAGTGQLSSLSPLPSLTASSPSSCGVATSLTSGGSTTWLLIAVGAVVLFLVLRK